MTTPITETVEYWKQEIENTELQLSALMKNSDLKSAKSDTDSVTYQGIKERMGALKQYLAYCKARYEECLNRKPTTSEKSILYFDREYGY